MTLFFVDTNIWLDFLLERKDKYQSLGEIAFKFFFSTLRREHEIVISETLIDELIKQIGLERLNGLIMPFEKIIVKVEETNSLTAKAKFISNIRNLPQADIIYALLAKKHGAIVVTRDKHFKELSDICISKRPEEII